MERITEKALKAKEEYLNTISNKIYKVSYGNGYCGLYEMANTAIAKTIITGCTKRELYDTMCAIINYHYSESD